MSYLFGEFNDNIIRVGREYKILVPRAATITVTSVTDTEVQFSRKGVSGISMMPIKKFAEIINAKSSAGAAAALAKPTHVYHWCGGSTYGVAVAVGKRFRFYPQHGGASYLVSKNLVVTLHS